MNLELTPQVGKHCQVLRQPLGCFHGEENSGDCLTEFFPQDELVISNGASFS